MANDAAGTFPAGKGRRSAFPASDGSGNGGASAGAAVAQELVGDAAPDLEGKVPGGHHTARGASAPGRTAAVLAAVAGGIAAAILGTLLHGQLLHVGVTDVPAGALAALVLAGSVFLLCGLWARNVTITAVAGAVAYGVVALLSTSSKTLILTGSSEAAPGTALAGNIWLFGVLVVTLGAVVVGSILLRPRRT
ncbi:hypothetical protein D6T63_12665 [Arthrobacter cheniae]|uniref:Uncharacterized protein n=1 Tax=Arthrobacter cheniae TaxID=1258888 RepID=A0A3A5M258_9MICC|nr:hypothetical protein [Arthrobacter cheniae]RJT78358.1 hypothetical protein D6T63_12665 [Arthrobacter cheniae]